MDKNFCKTIRASMLGLGLLFGGGVLSGCGSADLSDLKAYVERVKSREAPPLDPMPEFRLASQAPAPSTRVDPFKPFYEQDQPVVIAGPHPDRHVSQELERYELDALRMVGIVEFSGEICALVRAPDGVVHRVSAGNYLGENAGKVTFIDETGLELRELVTDLQGQWIERFARIDLSN